VANNDRRGAMTYAACYLAMVAIWGLSWIAIKGQLNGTPPLLSIALRFGLASLLLFVFCLIRGRRLVFLPSAHARMALLGLSLYAAPFFFLYQASVVLPSGIVALVFSSTLVFNLVFARIFDGGSIDALKILACAIGLSGLALLTGSQAAGQALGHDGLVGGLFALMGALLGSLGSIVSTRNRKAGIQIVEGNAFAMGYATLLILALAAASGTDWVLLLTPSYLQAWLYLSVLASVFGFGCYLYLVNGVGPEKAAYATVLFPVVSLCVSAFVEVVRWNAAALAGIVLILLGNAVLVWPRRAPAAAHRQAPPSAKQSVA
jgi:drug/metabolite transporter (DMT)-like permease